ncbi:uncharacterized protein LOC126997927 isoform X2 [Eriocheir sinensis]|uniref:uncharacterized protein LOC126997927 isoform X2 n=1 Tax=Eriocheir sinensis TaxID=95602 RepID=UPI0021C7C619|nr:uncharacterized protein LOC126997927 isoform X2 [Eriocheir sinensis]
MEVRRASVPAKVMDAPVAKERGGRMDPIGGAAMTNGVAGPSKSAMVGGKLSLGSLSGRGDGLATRRPSVSSDSVLSKGLITNGPLPYSGDMAGGGGGGNVRVVGAGRGAGGGGGVGMSGAASQGFVELSKRRLANDPAMMRELKRYQELMLKTLLPSISSGDGEHHYALPRPQHAQQSPDILPAHRGQPDGTDNPPEKPPSEHLPRPEPTDAISGATQHVSPRLCSSFNTSKSACSHGSQGSRTMPSGPASAGTRLPYTIYNPMDTSPRPSHRRRSNEEASPRKKVHRRSHDEGANRKRSHGDGGGEEEELDPSRLSGANGGELDMLTLAALYLESRHRVFGQEWHHRPDLPANARATNQVGGTGLGGPGIVRPRRLSPLSPSDTPPKDGEEDGDKESRMFSALMPTPAGLHLSVNYTHNLGLDESFYLAERARALRPRLRRLNSMDDLLPSSPGHPSSPNELQKATSAPDLSNSAHGRKGQLETESLSPPLVTPARANTPTEARHSAAMVRPQMVGGSLATNSTVDTARTVNNYGHGQDVVGNALTKKKQLTQLPEPSRSGLPPPPPRLSLRGSLDTPTPAPTNEGAGRKMGRVHLQPLSVRKTSN